MAPTTCYSTRLTDVIQDLKTLPTLIMNWSDRAEVEELSETEDMDSAGVSISEVISTEPS